VLIDGAGVIRRMVLGVPTDPQGLLDVVRQAMAGD
jgi:hypothetical protein